MKTFVNCTTYFLILLGLCSCNGDVFVDNFQSADSELRLNGNGDVATIRFASSNWDLLEVMTYDDHFSEQYRVYDADGNLICSGDDTKGFYQILALKTYVTRHLFLHVGYQLSKFKDPNNLMLGLGSRFHDKR